MRKRSQRWNLVILRIFRDMKTPKFGSCPYRICMAPDFEKIFGVKNRKFLEFFLWFKVIPKGFPNHLHPILCLNSTGFTPYWSHFEALYRTNIIIGIRHLAQPNRCPPLAYSYNRFWANYNKPPTGDTSNPQRPGMGGHPLLVGVAYHIWI